MRQRWFLLCYITIGLNEKNEGNIVCDYSLFQDYCYAVNNLRKAEKTVFESLYNYLIKQILPADLIIYLKCNVECLLQRIKERDRRMEQNISKEYLQDNIDTIEKHLFIQDNILIVESDKYNFIENDKNIVIEMIKNRCERLRIL